MNPVRATKLLSAGAALVWLLASAWLIRSQATGRLSDFAAFYAGGRLVGTGQLYDARLLQQAEIEFAGRSSPSHGFLRPPFHALLFWLLARLPYRVAEAVWIGITTLAFAGFIWLWPGLKLSGRWVVVGISLPAAIGIANGQDTPLMLLAATFAASLHGRNFPFIAGAAFSICAAKPHLFLLLPLLLIRRREIRFSTGLFTGGAALAVVSTVAEGWEWPLRMWSAAMHPAFSPAAGLMPNLAGALHGYPAAGWIYAVTAAMLATLTWTTISRIPFHGALAAMLAASLPLAPHSYLPDCVLLLPAVSEALSRESRFPRFAGILLATPLPYAAVFLDRPFSMFAALAPVFLVAAISLSSLKRQAQSFDEGLAGQLPPQSRTSRFSE